MVSHENGIRKPSFLQKHFLSILLFAVILFGFGIRLYQLGDRSIWFDEAATSRYIQFPFSEMYQRLHENIHPPAHYTAVKLWRYLFGDSLFMLRGLSVIFSTVSIFLTYRIALFLCQQNENFKKNHERIAGLIAAAFMSICIFQIRLAWELRMYAMGVMLVLLSTYLLLLAFYTKKHLWKIWIFYSLTIALCAYTHYSTFFVIAGQFLFIATRIGYELWRQKVKNITEQISLTHALVAISLFVLLFIPWIPTFLYQKKLVNDGWWDPPFHINQVLYVLPNLIIPDMVYGISWTFGGIVVILFLLSYILAIFFYGGKGWFLVCVGLVPFALIVIQSIHGTNLILDRFLSYQQPFIIIAFVLALTKIPLPPLRNLLCLILFFWGIDAYMIYMNKLDIPSSPGARGVADYLKEHLEPEDHVVVSNPLLFFPILFYMGPESGITVYAERGNHFAHFCGAPLVRLPDMTTKYEMSKCPEGQKVWVVTSSGAWGSDFPFYIPETWEKTGQSKRFRDIFACPPDYIIQAYIAKSEKQEFE